MNLFLKFGIGLFIWIQGINAIPFILETIDSTRTAISCTDLGVSFATKLVCLNVDLIIPYIIWTLAVIVIGVIISRE